MGNFSHRILGIRIKKKNSTGKQFLTPFHSIRGSSHQRRHPTSRDGGQDLMEKWFQKACQLCICGGAKCKCPLLDTYIESYIYIYVYIYIYIFVWSLFSAHISWWLPIWCCPATDSEIWNSRRICSRKTKVKVQYLSHLNWWVVWNRPPVSKIGDGHDDHDHDTVGDDVLIFHDQMLVLQGWILWYVPPSAKYQVN